MNLCDYNTIQELLGRHGFHFSKSMGQNFLIDPAVPADIAAASQADADCGVLEIGPGIGPLTAELAQRAGKVVSVELDKSLLPVLADFFYDTEEEEELEPVIEIHPTVCIGQGNLREEGLLLYEGRDTYPDYHIQKEVCTVGKDQASDLLLQKETVSRHHAKIRKMEDGYYIEDLNSTNGTYLNDELLSYKEPRLLHSSDLICFADVKYRFI